MLVLRPESGQRPPRLAGTVAVLTAGTGDAFVAEECRRTAELMGCYTFRLQARPRCFAVCFSQWGCTPAARAATTLWHHAVLAHLAHVGLCAIRCGTICFPHCCSAD